MNFLKEDYHFFFKRISSFAYDLRVKSDGTLVCECATDTIVYVTGYTFEEVNTHDRWLSLIHPDSISIFAKQLDCLLCGQSNKCEFRIITKGGEIRWLRNYAHPARGEAQDRVVRIYGIAQDITEQRRNEVCMQESESDSYRLLETAHAVV